MKRMNLRRTLSAAALLGGTIVAAGALAETPQGANSPGMMGGYGFGWMGGYGGIWMPLLLVIVVASLVAWFVTQKRK